MIKLNEDEYELLTGWEEIAKRGQLTLWIMLALKDNPKHMARIKTFISSATNGTLSADDQSMYRALRRYYDAGLVDYMQEKGKGGPERKVYKLTDSGQKVLSEFLRRNIKDMFYSEQVMKLVNKEYIK